MQCLENISLKEYNSFGIDVCARMLIRVDNLEELKILYTRSPYKEMQKMLIGKGCNLLFLENYSGALIQIEDRSMQLQSDGEEVVLKVGTGWDWDDLLDYCVEKNWWGLESLVGIPGRVGSAPVQNIGAYGGEIKDVLESVEVLDLQTLEILEISNADCKFAYRNSIFKSECKGRYAIGAVRLRLSRHPQIERLQQRLGQWIDFGNGTPDLRQICSRIREIRNEKLPSLEELGCAGSFFKNPLVSCLQYEQLARTYSGMPAYPQAGGVKLSAAWLIDRAGWKGYREENVGVYPKQPLVLVNYGGGSGKEVVALAEKIQKSVFDKFGVHLENEVNYIGNQDRLLDEEYEETLQILYACLPMFQRVGAAAYKPNLDNTYQLMDLIGHPYTQFKSVHVAGTNGKGSSSHSIASVLQQAGYKVGLYTSPHLRDFRERIRVNGEMISKREVVGFYRRYAVGLQRIKSSFFEMTVAMAFEYFAKEKVDVAVIEVGMGGRLDSTNVITPLVSLITNISLDHMKFLGDTVEKIAVEKAGIIKPGVDVVVSEAKDSLRKIFREKAEQEKADIYFAEDDYRLCPKKSGKDTVYDVYAPDGQLLFSDLVYDLKGESYQIKNLKGILCTLQRLTEKLDKIDEKSIRSGLAHVVSNTGLKGRWQCLSERPYCFCDTGHNEDGIRCVLEQIQKYSFDKLHIVWGMVNDKDISTILGLLPKDARYYFSKPSVERGLPVETLMMEAERLGLKGEGYETVEKACLAARKNAAPDDFIYIGGSTFVVAEIC